MAKNIISIIRRIFVKNSAGTTIDPATTQDVQAVRDRLPTAVDTDGGLKVHLQNSVSITPSTVGVATQQRIWYSVHVNTTAGTPVTVLLRNNVEAIHQVLSSPDDGTGVFTDVTTSITFPQTGVTPVSLNRFVDSSNRTPCTYLILATPADGVTVSQRTGDAWAVSATSLPLPTNAAQETGGNLAAINTELTNVPNVIATPGSAVPSKALEVAGTDGTNARAFKTNTSGQLDVRPLTSADQVTTVPSGTQTVSGTVTANQGTAAAPSGSWPVEVTDGTNVLGTSAHPIRTDPTGTTTQPVSGTVTTVPSGTQNENLTQVGGTAVSTGAGATGAGSQRVTVAQDSTTVAGSASLPAGTNAIGTVVTNADTAIGGTVAPSKELLVAGKTTDATPQYQPIPLTNAGAAVKTDGSATTQPISAASLPLPAGASTSANQTNGTQKTQVVDGSGNVQPAGDVSARAIKVDGSAVTQPVSGTVTANQGTSPWVTNDPGLPDTLGQKTAVGSTSVVLASDQGAVPVTQSTSPWVTTVSNATVTGTINGSGQTVTLTVPDGMSDNNIQFTGSFVGTVQFESSVDGGTTYNARVYRHSGILNDLETSTSTFPSEWRGNVAGMSHFRVRCTAYTSGTLTVAMRASTGTGSVFLNAAVPIGGQSVGNTVVAQTVSAGTSWTGAWEDNTNVASASVSVIMTQAGTLHIQWSQDGSTLFDEVTFPLIANTVFEHIGPSRAQYYRLVADNTSGSSATLNVETIYRAVVLDTARFPIAYNITDTTLAGVDRAILTAKNTSTGQYGNILQGPSGGLGVDILSFQTTASATGTSAASTTLSGNMTNSQNTIPVNALDNFPSSGTVLLTTLQPSAYADGAVEEIATYTGKSAGTGAGNLTGVTRGQSGTNGISHSTNDQCVLVGPGNSISISSMPANTTYVGPWENVQAYASIGVNAIATQNSALNGAEIEWSNDAITPVRGSQSTIFSSSIVSTGGFFAFGPEAKYFRIRYTTGSVSGQVNSTTIYRPVAIMAPEVPIGANITDYNLSTLARSVLAGKQPDGTYFSLRASGFSTANSTTALLGSNATFTGAFEDLTGYVGVDAFIQASVNSATNGVMFDWSDDGVTVRLTNQYTYSNATSGQNFVTAARAKYFRIRYTNGSSAQTGSWVLQTQYNTAAIENTKVQLSENVTSTQLANINKTEIIGKDGSGTYQNLSVSSATGTNAINAGNNNTPSLNVNINQATASFPLRPLTGWSVSQISVGTSAVQLDVSQLANRKTVSLKSLAGNNQTIYVGPTNAVTSSNGYAMANGEFIDLPLDTTAQVWAIASAASQSIVILQVS